MKQLTGLDAGFLYMETPNSFGHVSSLTMYERPSADFDPYQAYRDQLESRLHLLDPFRRKLAEVPLNLDHPYWINDPDFDLDFHLRHIAIPAPGSTEKLADQVARIIGRPLDRSRPLWEIYVLEGLENDEFAVLTKVHHSTVDGAVGVEMLMMMLDVDPEGDVIDPDTGSWKADRMPSDINLLGRTALSYMQAPGKLARVQLRALQQVAETVRARGVAQMIETTRKQMPRQLGGSTRTERTTTPSITAPETPFNKNITAHRRLAMRSTPLQDIKTLKTELGVTLNDVVMAVCAGALRNYLIEHDCLPDQPLRAMVPVSIRSGDEEDKWTNRVSGLVCDLPTNVEDPLERVQLVHESMVEAKDQFDMMPAEAIVEMSQFMLPALAVQASRVAGSMRLADRTNSPVNVVISNVPGPRVPLYMGGAKMTHFYPVSTVTDGVGLNITVQSYLDTLDFGLVSCRELIPDLDYLLDLHVEEIDVLFSAGGIKRANPVKKAATRTPATKKAATKKTTTKKTTTTKTVAKKTVAKKTAAKKTAAKL